MRRVVCEVLEVDFVHRLPVRTIGDVDECTSRNVAQIGSSFPKQGRNILSMHCWVCRLTSPVAKCPSRSRPVQQTNMKPPAIVA